jgi:hypothetical protein
MRSTLALLLAPVAALLLAPAPAAAAEWFADLELGAVAASRNDVRIPGNGGTTFSLVNDLTTYPAPYGRGEVGATFAERHTVFATWAPVRLAAHGYLPTDVFFHGATFAAGSPVSARWVFDTYRLTYRYGAVRTSSLDLDVGATALLRDAAVALQGTWYSQKTSVGLVPLLSFRVAWRFAGPFALVADGDAFATSKGRLEDVLLAVEWTARPGVALRAGYRIIEGGVDTAEVYDLALLNHFGVGVTVKL